MICHLAHDYQFDERQACVSACANVFLPMDRLVKSDFIYGNEVSIARAIKSHTNDEGKNIFQ